MLTTVLADLLLDVRGMLFNFLGNLRVIDLRSVHVIAVGRFLALKLIELASVIYFPKCLVHHPVFFPSSAVSEEFNKIALFVLARLRDLCVSFHVLLLGSFQ